MRTTTLGTALLSISIVSAFVSVLFSNVSFAILSVSFATSYIYAYRRFVSELERISLKIERKVLDEMPFAAEPMSISVEVLNTDPMAVRGTFEDVLPEDCKLYAGSNKSDITLPPRSVLRLSYSMIPEKRGPHVIPGMRIDRTDAFGLFDEEQMVEHRSIVNVHTEKGSIDAARKIAGKEHLEFSGIGRNPAVVLRELEFDGIRDYVPGDRARDIHWKLLPKLNKLMTKTYRKEGSVRTMVFIDCGRSMRLEAYKVAKIDHALNLSMQLSNVLLSSLHPAGVATFDEMHVIDKVSPGLGKHQFEKIVNVLRNVPSSVKQQESASQEPSQAKPANSLPLRIGKPAAGDDGKEFLSALDKLSASGSRRRLGIGLEGGIKEVLASSKGQQQLFLVISDLMSSRDAVLAGAKICQSTGNRMLVIHTYDDWYKNSGTDLDLPNAERLYEGLSESIKVEAALRGLGASYIRIGPADTAPRIVRAIRRGKT